MKTSNGPKVGVVERIHRDFAESINVAERSLNDKIEMFSEVAPVDNVGAMELGALGFSSSKTVVEFKTKKSEFLRKHGTVEEMKTLKDCLAQFHRLMPNYRLIYFAQIMDICEKYNLFMAPASEFVSAVPLKNIEDIKNFRAATKIAFELHKTEKPHTYSPFQIEVNYMVCAGEKDFKQGGHKIGRLLNYNPELGKPKFQLEFKPAPPDPIVLSKVTFQQPNGNGYPGLVRELQFYAVVTAWGEEAKEVVAATAN